MQQLYSLNPGTNVLPTTISIAGGQPAANPVPEGEDGLFASAVIDQKKGEIIVKVINTLGNALSAQINITGLSKKQLAALPATAEVTSLNCADYDAENQPGRPEVISPVTTTVPLTAGSILATIPAKTFALYKVKL